MRRPVEVPVDRGRLRDIRSLVDTIWRKRSLDTRHSIVGAGRYLSQLLLPIPVFSVPARSQERVGPDGLRIRLCLDRSLVDLPWEFLYWHDLTDQDS